MNNTQALAKLRKLLGPKAMYEIRNTSPGPDERAALRTAIPARSVERDAAKAAMEARRDELLRDPEYCRLTAEYVALRDEVAKMAGRQSSYRINVGRNVGGMFFSIRAQGDTWDEVFKKLEHK